MRIVRLYFRYDHVASIAMCLLMAGLLVAAFIMEHVFLLEPCPLCWVQRAVVLVLAITFLVGVLAPTSRASHFFVSSALIVFSLIGLVVAGRHVWLQHLPEGLIPECLPSVGYLMQTLPFFEVLAKIFEGSAECSEVAWELFGLSIPEQMLGVFFVVLVVGLLKLLLVFSVEPYEKSCSSSN